MQQPQQLRQTLDNAMRDRRPDLHRRLQQNSELPAALDSLLSNLQETAETIKGQALDRLSRQDSPQFQPDPLRRQQELTQQDLEAERSALEQAIEEIDRL